MRIPQSETCSICLNKLQKECSFSHMFQPVCQMNCNHSFHMRCIETWVLEKRTCPLCRQNPFPLRVVEPLTSHVVNNSIVFACVFILILLVCIRVKVIRSRVLSKMPS